MELYKAINEAASEHVVFFLTTAYIEALQHSPCASALPLHVTALPLDGMLDLRRRRDVLQLLIPMHNAENHSLCSELQEAREVFEQALWRLSTLNGCAQDAMRVL